MKLANDSDLDLVVNTYANFPPGPDNRVKHLQLRPRSSDSYTLDPGDYYVYMSTNNIGPYPAGVNVAGSGGVPSDATVTLTQQRRIAIT